MKVTRFDPASALIVVPGRIRNARGQVAVVQLAVDTGSSETVIGPEIIDALGYNPRQGEAMTVIRSAVGHEPGYLIRVRTFACLGFQFSDFRIHAHDLPEGYGIDGLLGLSFLRHFDYRVLSSAGRLEVERIDS